MRRNLFHDERGSLPMALLAAIILTGLMVVVMGTVITGQRQTRFDQRFEQALQIAEVGLDRMRFLAESKTISGEYTLEDTEVDGGYYYGRAVQGADGQWYLEATGVAADGTSRTVTMGSLGQSLFSVAAFGRIALEFKGGNMADAYRSGTWEHGQFNKNPTGSLICNNGGGGAYPDPTKASGANVKMCYPDGLGAVATNGGLHLHGNTINNVGRAEVHYASERIDNPMDGATGRCVQSQTACREDNVDSGKLVYFRPPIELPDPPVPFDPTGTFPDGDDEDYGYSENRLTSGPHVFTNVTLNSDTVIEGTPDNPTIIYYYGTLHVPNHEVVNFEMGPHGKLIPKPAPSLLIFAVGPGPSLDLGTHVHIAAGIYAPNAASTLGGSAGNVYGSLIVNHVDTRGGWGFHFDRALEMVNIGAPPKMRNWTEIQTPPRVQATEG
jgi:hypothetical protein